MKLACVVLNYNDLETTLDIYNLIKEYDQLDEVIIVDNCSPDGSYKELKKLENNHIHILETGKNGGYGAGNNVGLRYAKEKLNCTHAIVCNPDVEFSNETVEIMRNYFQQKHEKCIAMAPLVSTWEKSINAWYIPSKKEIYMKVYNNKRFLEKDKVINSKGCCLVETLQGAMLMVDIEKMQKMGLYDEDFFLYCEEDTLAIKSKMYGYESYLITECSYVHWESVSTKKVIKSRYKGQKIGFESRLLLLRKYYDAGGIDILGAKISFGMRLLLSRMIDAKNRNAS